MTAIIIKDIRGITSNKRMFTTLLVVPLVLTIFLPTVFIFVFHFMPEEDNDLQKLINLLPVAMQKDQSLYGLVTLLLNYILPTFFLIIPIMASSVMAATSFVGEKEKRTLETLLYCPLSLKQIFRSKVLASFLLSIFVSLVSFTTMLVVIETETYFLTNKFIVPDLQWLFVLLFVSPAISLIAITLTVRVSAKAQSVEDAQQSAVFLLMPILLIIIGQFSGILFVSIWILLIIGGICTLVATFLLKKSMRNFQYETLLK